MSMETSSSGLLQEVVLLREAPCRQVAIAAPTQRSPQAAGGLFRLRGRAGDAVLYADASGERGDERGMSWTIDNGASGVLRLAEFGLSSGSAPGVDCDFGELCVFPRLVQLKGKKSGQQTSITLVGLLSTGHLFYWDLDLAHGGAGMGDPSACMRFCDVSAQLASHGSPTALGATADTVLVGCSDGVTLCVPGGALPSPNAGPHCSELRASSWGLVPLLSSMVGAKAAQPSVVALMCHPGAPHLALAAYDNCTLKGFNLARQGAEVFSDSLLSSAASAASAPQRDGGGGGAKLALTSAMLCACPADPSAAVLVATLEGLPAVWGARLSATDRHDLTGAGNSGTVLSAGLDPARGVVWALMRAHGAARMLGFDRAGGALVRAAELQEEQPSAAYVGAARGGGGVEMVLCHLLSPSTLCRASLRDALSHTGAQLTMAEAASAPLAQLAGCVRGAVQALQRRSPGTTAPSAWVALMRAYLAAWSRRHAPLSVVVHGGSGVVGLVRAGGMVTCLRAATVQEALSAAAHRGTDLPSHGLLADTELRTVHSVVSSVAAQLGPLPLDAFVDLLASGACPTPQLLPVFAQMWLTGPVSASGRARDDVAREQQSRWRSARQRCLLDLGTRLGSLGDPIAALRRYVAALGATSSGAVGGLKLCICGGGAGGGTQPDGSSSSSSALPGPWASVLLASAQQQSRGCVEVLRDAALTLCLVRELGAFGGCALTHEQVDALDSELLPAVVAALQRAVLSLWLTSTPGSADGGGGGGVSGGGGEADLAALATLTLHSRGGSPAGTSGGAHTARVRVVPGGGGAHPGAHSASTAAPPDAPLAAWLLPRVRESLGLGRVPPLAQRGAECAFARGGGGGGGLSADVLEAASRALVAWLQCGSSSSATTSSATAIARGGHPHHPHSRVVLDLGLALFAARETSALMPLSALAAASGAADGSADFLRGLSLAVALASGGRSGSSSASSGADRSSMVAEAAGCFFCAAASLLSVSADALADTVSALRLLVTGLPEPAPTGVRSGSSDLGAAGAREALLQLRFYEAIMMLLERERAPEGALTFARAALQQLPAAYPAPGDAAARAALEGRLWANVFSYSVELGAWDSAYAAVLANPLPETSLDCLRRLVHELCERGQLLSLVGLPLSGVVTLHTAAAATTVTLLSEAMGALQRRARNSDLLTVPQPYKVLYDFGVTRSNFRGAAGAMLAYARRLRAEGTPGAAAEALAAYEASLNALSLLDDEDAWLDLSDPWMRLHATPPRAGRLLFGGGGGVLQADGMVEDADDDAVEQEEPVLTLSGLRREYLLLRCAVSAAATVPGLDPLQQWDGEDEVLNQLTLSGQWEAASALAHACWTGSQRTAALERVVGALAGAAARAQVSDDSSSPDLEHALSSEPAQREAQLGARMLWSRAAPLWASLRALLERHEGERDQSLGGIRVHAGTLRVAAADAVLRVDRRLRLPPWMLALFGFGVAATASAASSASFASPSGAAGGGGAAGAAAGGGDCGGAASLLSVYLSHDRLADGVCVLEELVAWWGGADARARRASCATWLPHHAAGELRGALLAAVGASAGRSGDSGLWVVGRQVCGGVRVERAARSAASWLPHHAVGELRGALLATVGALAAAGRGAGDSSGSTALLRRLDSALTSHADLVAYDSEVDPAQLRAVDDALNGGAAFALGGGSSAFTGAGGGGFTFSTGADAPAGGAGMRTPGFGGSGGGGWAPPPRSGSAPHSPFGFGFGGGGFGALSPPPAALLPPPIASIGGM
ncbi:hypothetical protein FOA52_013913 [Chlamydomonas sp. UWO 241]|nr:hypothetical protein FOA52_013913 [Chlamydomonas sp. UWO 241]